MLQDNIITDLLLGKGYDALIIKLICFPTPLYNIVKANHMLFGTYSMRFTCLQAHLDTALLDWGINELAGAWDPHITPEEHCPVA